MNEEESFRCLVVLFIGDTDAGLVKETISNVKTFFGSHLQGGLLEIVVPDPSYYPNSSTYR